VVQEVEEEDEEEEEENDHDLDQEECGSTLQITEIKGADATLP
jgi:hypothetical protein